MKKVIVVREALADTAATNGHYTSIPVGISIPAGFSCIDNEAEIIAYDPVWACEIQQVPAAHCTVKPLKAKLMLKRLSFFIFDILCWASEVSLSSLSRGWFQKKAASQEEVEPEKATVGIGSNSSLVAWLQDHDVCASTTVEVARDEIESHACLLALVVGSGSEGGSG